MSVFLLFGLFINNSLINCKLCLLPFFAGTNTSSLSVKMPNPMLSLFFMAEKINDAAISKPKSFLLFLYPKSLLAELSYMT